MDRGAWRATAYRVAESDRTEVSEQARKLGKNVTGVNNVKIPSQISLLCLMVAKG